MTNTPGYSFAPTFENAEMGRRGGAPAEFPQGAIKVLNFRIPRVAGAPGPNAISPLVGDRPSGAFGSAVLQSVLKTVLGPDAAAALTSAAPAAGSAPAAPGRPPRDTFDDWVRRERDLNGRSPGSRTPLPPAPTGGPDFEGPVAPPQPPPPPAPDRDLPVVVRPGGDDERSGPVSEPENLAAPEFENVSWLDRKRAMYGGEDY